MCLYEIKPPISHLMLEQWENQEEDIWGNEVNFKSVEYKSGKFKNSFILKWALNLVIKRKLVVFEKCLYLGNHTKIEAKF